MLNFTKINYYIEIILKKLHNNAIINSVIIIGQRCSTIMFIGFVIKRNGRRKEGYTRRPEKAGRTKST